MPSSELLKKYLGTSKKPSVVLGSVERHLLGRTPDFRDSTVLHPSEIVSRDWCLRASWFLLNGRSKPFDPPGLRLSSIFAEGHLIHHKWQGWFTEMNALIGVWECKQCKVLWWGKRQDTHQECEWVVYREVPVFGFNGYLTGSGDGWLDHLMFPSMDEDHLLEIKSIGTGTVRTYGGRIDAGGLEKTFSSISSPYPGQVRQVVFYLWLLEQMFLAGDLSQAPPKKALLLYECKADQAVKEFVVDYDPDWLVPVFDKLSTFNPNTKVPPPCSSGKTHCKQCKEYV